MADRPSLIDVFENYLGESPSRLRADVLESLTDDQSRELVELLDDHLIVASEEGYPSDAVLLDSLSDPVIFPTDPLQPMTTRKTKQVALYHTEVVIPMQPLYIDLDIAGPSQLQSLFVWCRTHEALLNRHIVTFAARPNVLVDLGEQPVRRLVKKLRRVLSELENDPTLLAALGADGMIDEDFLDASLYALVNDVYHASKAGADLCYLDASDFKLLAVVRDEVAKGIGSKRNGSKMSLLQRLDLPATDQLANEDFVAIRLASEEFAEYRKVLGAALDRARTQEGLGVDLEDAFDQSLDECRSMIGSLEGQLKKSGLGPRLRERLQTMAISIAASSTSAMASSSPELHAKITLAAASAGTSALLSLLFVRTKTDKKRTLLRFYKVLADDRVEI